MKKKIFITGGTGYVGTQLVRALLARGESVRVLLYDPKEADDLRSEPEVEFIPGGILDQAALKTGMKGCDRVFHLAAYAKNYAKDRNLFFKINVEGTRNVLDAAQENGEIKKIVCTSTIVTLGPTHKGQVANESTPRTTERYFTEYEESKAVAEKLMLERAKELPITIVNPTRVYGPGKNTEGNSLSKMIELYVDGKFPFLLGGGTHIGNYVFVRDLVLGHILALDKGRVGERYILGGENVDLVDFFKLVAEVSGKKRKQFALPAMIARTFSMIEKVRADLSRHYPVITPGWVDTFLVHWAYSCDKAVKELGYEVTPLKRGIEVTWQSIQKQREAQR